MVFVLLVGGGGFGSLPGYYVLWLNGWLRIRVFGGFVFRVKGVCFGGGGFGFPLKGVGVAVRRL